MARILLIEDSPTEAAVLTQLLEKNGHVVMASVNAEDGIDVCRRERPDLVLMDVILPGMNGFQATRTITRDETTKHIPVLIVSTKGMDTDRAWGRITRWRGLLAAALDQAPYESVESAVVVGAPDSPSADLLAAWLHARLKCPVRLRRSKESSGVIAVELTRASGVLELHRPVNGNAATLSTPGQPDRTIALAHRSDA